jgi:hypothetical protein
MCVSYVVPYSYPLRKVVSEEGADRFFEFGEYRTAYDIGYESVKKCVSGLASIPRDADTDHSCKSFTRQIQEKNNDIVTRLIKCLPTT